MLSRTSLRVWMPRQANEDVKVNTKTPIRRYANERLLRATWQRGVAPYIADTQREDRASRVEILTIKKGRVHAPSYPAFAGDVLIRVRLYYADDVPTQIAQSYVPWEIADGTAMINEDTGPGGLYARLEEAGHRLWRFREHVSVHAPDESIRKLLQLDDDDTVTRVLREAFDTTGMVIEICDTVMASHRTTLVYEMSPEGLAPYEMEP